MTVCPPRRVRALLLSPACVLAGLLAAAWPARAQGPATAPAPAPSEEAYAQCVARWSPWSSAGGIWTGDLVTPGAQRGEPRFRRIQMHVKFATSGVTVSLRRPGHPWRRVGSDPSAGQQQGRRKDEVFIAIPNDRPSNRMGHAVMLKRLSDTVAEVSYSRTILRPRPGEAVVPEGLMTGVLARAGQPVPAGMQALGSQCAPARAEKSPR